MIWGAELARTVRSSRAVVLLLLYLMFTLMAFVVFNGIARSFTAQLEARAQGVDPEAMSKARKEIRSQIVTTFFADDEAMAEALAVIPLVLLLVFKISLRFLPLFASIMGFDQISGEVGPRSIRYLTVRSRRSSVMFGKFLAQATILAVLMLLIDAGLCIYARFSEPDFTTSSMLLTLARFWLSAVVFSLAYLALTTLCSALFRQPPVSLVFNIIVLFVIWLMAFIGEFFRLEPDPRLPPELASQMVSKVAYLRYGSLWHYSSDLLHPQLSHFGVAGLAHMGFALLFLGGAYLVLRGRDL
ncbi:MAG: ABC transporter permease [Myxococcaceae bacterium]